MQERNEEDVIDLVQEAKDIAKRDWQRKAYNCARTGTAHDFIPSCWELTPKSKTLTMMVCKKCFHHVNLAEAWEHRG